MKKMQSLLILTMLFYSSNLAAQINRWQIGFELGTGMRWFKDDSEIDYDKPAISFANGVTVKYNFTENLALRSGFNYEKKGYKAKLTYTDNTGNEVGQWDTYTNLNYVTMPVFFQVSFGDRIKPYFFGGPFGSILVKAKRNVMVPDEDIKTTDIKDFYKDFDWGLATGGGAIFEINSQFSVSAEMRVNLGLYNITPSQEYYSTSVMTRTFNVMAGFIYSIPSSTSQK
jgi:opacity protein-like surface antigen